VKGGIHGGGQLERTAGKGGSHGSFRQHCINRKIETTKGEKEGRGKK